VFIPVANSLALMIILVAVSVQIISMWRPFDPIQRSLFMNIVMVFGILCTTWGSLTSLQTVLASSAGSSVGVIRSLRDATNTFTTIPSEANGLALRQAVDLTHERLLAETFINIGFACIFGWAAWLHMCRIMPQRRRAEAEVLLKA
jgi:hypothetical protein